MAVKTITIVVEIFEMRVPETARHAAVTHYKYHCRVCGQAGAWDYGRERAVSQGLAHAQGCAGATVDAYKAGWRAGVEHAEEMMGKPAGYHRQHECPTCEQVQQ